MQRSYETLFIIRTSLEEESLQGLVEKFKNLLESSAVLEKMEEWGRRKLAYPIDDETEGYYVLAQFQSEPEFPTELERILKITDGILKYLVTRREE